jgi:hypothetical protein
MGANPYWYLVPYEADVGAALQKLRTREFQAGRYNPVTPFQRFPIDPSAPTVGTRHGSIEEVMKAVDESGTRSILDISQVASESFDGSQMPYFTAFPLSAADVEDLFGTLHPTRELIEKNQRIWDRIERGSALYVIVFDGGKPNEIFFAGYSFD